MDNFVKIKSSKRLSHSEYLERKEAKKNKQLRRKARSNKVSQCETSEVL